jgi:aminoglycoside phosphotransferase family enzyme/predicted kinase
MDFSDLLEALQNPEIYPEKPEKVEMLQTHASAVFIVGEHVYKVKKPVNFGFLDFTTLEKRKYFCREEVVLNRRLCPEVYLGVAEIRLQNGRILLGEKTGDIIEYAVLMKKLPQDCMMDRRLAAGKVTLPVLQRIAAKVAQFHDQAEARPEIASFGRVEVIRTNADENFSQMEKYVGITLAPEVFQGIRDHTRAFIEAHRPLFERRLTGGRIRDCHGDLHLEHICLGDEILIFDCIEFNPRFRYGDVAADLAFLLMDLDFHGHAADSAELAAAYLSLSRDWPLYLLLNFYKAYRACVRGKVFSFRLDDPAISPRDKAAAQEEAGRYFRLARQYAAKMNRPALVLTSGLMGAGKSTFARALTEALGWKRLSSDIVRKELAHLSPHARRYEPFQQGLYAPAFSETTYQTLFARAEALLQAGASVILDASFQRARDRTAAWDLARKMRADFLLVECRSEDEIIRGRLEGRRREKTEPSDGRWELFQEQKRIFEKIEGWDPDLHLSLNTRLPLEEGLERFFRHLLKREAGAEEKEKKEVGR